MSDKKYNSSESPPKVNQASKKADKAKLYISFLTPDYRVIKQNLQYLVSLLAEKEHREDFLTELGIDMQTIRELQAFDRKFVPSDDIILKIEAYFEKYLDMGEIGCKLKDENLVEKLRHKGYDVTHSGRDTKRIKNNIRILRKRYGETQAQLGKAIGEGTTAISNYENPSNGKLPSQEKLLAIAKHYNITVDELLYYEFPDEPIREILVNSKETVTTIFEELFPFLEYSDSCSEEKKNVKFIKALGIHEELLNYVLEGSTYEHIDAITELMQLYDEAAKEGAVEALGNHLWWLMYFGISIFTCNDELLENIDKVKKEDTTTIELYKLGILKQPAKTQKSFDNDMKNLQQHFLYNYEKMIIRDIYLLKQTECYELADYYAALRYIYGIVDNDLTRELNSTVGHEMMRTFYLMGNPYVHAFYELYNVL